MLKKVYQILFLALLAAPQLASGNWESEVDSLKSILTEEIDDSTRIKVNHKIAALLFMNQPEASFNYIQQVVQLAQKTKDSLRLYDGYIGIGDYFSLTNDYHSALEYFYKAYALTSYNPANRAYCHSRLSEVYFFLDDMDKALEHAILSLKINKELQDSLQMTYDYHNLAMWHLEFDHLDSSLYYLKMAEDYYKNRSEEPNPIFFSHLGQVYAYRGDYDSALYYHFKALEIDKANFSEYEIAVDENYIGHTYLMQGDYNLALRYGFQSLERAEKINLIDVKLYNYELLQEAYEKKGNTIKALEYARLRNDYADSLRDKNKESLIQAFNAKYKFKEQEQLLKSQEAENKLLKKQKKLLLGLTIASLLFFTTLLILVLLAYRKNKDNKKLLNELEQANSSKEKIISVISHDLRSSIGTLRNSIQLINEESLDDETTKNLLETFFPVVDSTYDLLENLLTWAAFNKGNLNPNLENTYLNPIIEKSIRHTQHLADSKNIEITNKIEDVIITADKNMLSIVTRNLLSNAVKFSKPNSKVLVASSRKKDIVEITVSDDGVGIKPEVLSQILTKTNSYHSSGTRGERGSGLGLYLCKSFVEKQGGHIKASSTPGHGSQFTISIPVASKN
jgi:signal transduction histidine kinase